MASSRIATITPPYKGIVRRTAMQDSVHSALYDARDFWPWDAKTGRERLSVRPGWAAYGDQNNVNLIATLNVAPNESFKRLLITAASGTLYRWNGTSASAIGTGIETGRNIQAAPYLQKLYIATGSTPKVYSYQSGTLGNWNPTEGDIPTGCQLICEWANRMVLAGDPDAPHVWYMSRIGDPDDWLFAEDDLSSPVAAADIEGGQIGEPITSLIPHNRECVIFGTANSLSVLRGDPMNGGRFERISHVTGPVNGTAWCKTADDWTYMLTRDGLYRMPPGCGSAPLSVSREYIPESLLNVDGVNTKALLAYDVRFRGVHVYITGDTNEYWWFDVQREGFWPMTVPGTDILAIGRHDPIETADESGVLVGTSEGLRRLDRNEPLGGEDGAYAKYIFPIAQLGEKGLLRKATVKFGANTDDMSGEVNFYGAETAEEVVESPAERKQGTTVGTLQDNHGTCHARVGGQFGMMELEQANTQKHITFEQAAFTVAKTGRERG